MKTIEENTMTIPRDEFTSTLNRLSDKIDNNHKETIDDITMLKVNLGSLQQTVNNLHIPVLPTRPCEHFQKHITDLENRKESWQKPVIASIVTIIVAIFIQRPTMYIIEKIFNK